MIFVTLGTQDKSFTRLLDAIENNIKEGNITDKVIVQAGSTKYRSKYMEIHKMMSKKKFEQYMRECDILITHGGVGTILDALKLNKKIIAVPRRKEFKEHENNHQLQIIEKFSEEGYLLYAEPDTIKNEFLRLKDFNPKSYKGNNTKIINLLKKYIDLENGNRKKHRMSIASMCCFFILHIIIYYLLINISIPNVMSDIISGLISYSLFSLSLSNINECKNYKWILGLLLFCLIDTSVLSLPYRWLLTFILYLCNYIGQKILIFRGNI